jgi:hypothetical protein
MKTHFLEATNDDLNWGKFLVCIYDDEEKSYKSQMCPDLFGRPLLVSTGRGRPSFWLLDLQTGEGAEFYPPAPKDAFTAKFDLDKHAVWVCPMYEPTLVWLYQNSHLVFGGGLPGKINLPNAEFSFRGYRRPGPRGAEDDRERDDQGADSDVPEGEVSAG